MNAPALALRHLSKRFDDPDPVIFDVELEVMPGEFLCVLGPSGCGKTTLLRLICGLETPDTGEVAFEGRIVSRPEAVVSPEERGMGMVFQDVAIFPHLTVADNVAFGLHQPLRRRLLRWLGLGESEGGKRTPGHSPVRRRRRVRALLRLVGLEEMSDRFPHELSGGEQQRVALARALAPGPTLMLLDEPFSSLDAALRQRIREDVRSVLKRLGVTTILVTHDQEEAVNFADRIAVLDAGRIQQVGTPEEILRRPANRFVAAFVGLNSFVRGRVVGGEVRTELGTHPLPANHPALEGEVDVLLRPDDIQPAENGAGLLTDVERVDYLGVQPLYTLALPSGTRVQALLPGHLALAPGDRIAVRFRPPHIVMFPTGDDPTPQAG